MIKLYNAGSFFDPRAVPVAEYPDVAARTPRPRDPESALAASLPDPRGRVFGDL